MHVYDNPRMLGRIVPGADLDSDEMSAREAALDKLNELREVLRSSRMAFLDVAVERGDAVHCILEHARTGDFDLIVMGTHGRRGLERAVMGSVAEGVIRHATIPVVTIHLPR